MKRKLYTGYKGPGMCKHCAYSYYGEISRIYYCADLHLSIRKAAHICKGIKHLKDV